MAVYKEIPKADGSGMTTFYRLSTSRNTVEVDESEGNADVIDYNQAQNKPSINGVALVGDKSSQDLGLQPAGDYITNTQADAKYIDNDELAAMHLINETQLEQALANLSHFHREIVQALPVTGEDNVLYLVPKGGTGPDVYNEYIWVGLTQSENGYEFLGTTATDLTNYYTKSQVDTIANTKVTKETGKGLTTNDYTTAEKTKLAGLENYDDAALQASVASLNSSVGTLTTTVNTLDNTVSALSPIVSSHTSSIASINYTLEDRVTAIRLVEQGDGWIWMNLAGDNLTYAQASNALGQENCILYVELLEDDGKVIPAEYKSETNHIIVIYKDLEGLVHVLDSSESTTINTVLGKDIYWNGKVASEQTLPVSAEEGEIRLTRDTNEFYMFDGTAWVPFYKGNVDLSNYLAKNNTTAWIPTGDFNPATKKYVDDSINALNIPTSTSQLINDAGFIGKGVNNLTNYYNKSQVDNMITQAEGVADINVTGDTLNINTSYISSINSSLDRIIGGGA